MSIRIRRAHLHSRTHIVGFGIAGLFGFIALLITALFFSLSTLVGSWLENLPDYTSADAYLVAEPTTVYAADNSVLAEYYLQNRRSVDLDKVSNYVKLAIVDTEDVRFYKHNGVDPQGIVRAVVAQISGGAEGASTITQQLVRNTVLSNEQFEQSLKRKVREAYIAIQMEKMYTKDQILNMYLNTIYFGHSAYGIQAAAITYFNKNASDLTLAEAATLCGLPQSPSVYDPIQNPDAATARRNIVLDRMLHAGHITQAERDAAVAEPLVTNEGHFGDSIGAYPYFADYVKQLLLEDFDSETVMQGGLKVHTTLDPAMQEMAQNAVDGRLEAMGNSELEAALVAVDPSNGYIKAVVGGRDYNEDQFNLATQAQRQPGSSFKTYTLATALSQGMNPQISINCNSPMTFAPAWRVQNFGNESYGYLTLSQAFAYSSNTGFAQVIQAVGANNVVNMAHAMGIDVEIPAYDSITLGTVGIPVVQMAEGYATVAAGGKHRDAIAITKIEDRNGNTVYEHVDAPTQVLTPEVASAMVDVMKGVCRGSGTASVVSSTMTANQPVAGKTGTSESYRDLWFCGITPQLSVAVWCGYRQEDTVYVGGTYGHPYNTAVPIFVNFVNDALADTPRADFPEADGSPDYKSNSSWDLSGSTSSYGYSSSSSYYSN
ncbi:MAG: penicillin-binding protein [Olsenella sp.]|nr:penicillin-binding protein [Olsenella sp.]